MAGAGYKLFNTGDVLTAAQVNTYLMEQTVMVFNDAASRTTALSGVVAEGMLSYLKSTKQVEVYNGSAWVASDDPNAIQNTIVDAKGDLIAATANDTPARLAVGNNGETLVADSSTATGLRYNPQNALANPVINGGMDFWQRGTSIAGANLSTNYVCDRWIGFRSGSTFSRQFVSDSTNLPNIQYSCRMQRNSGTTGTSSIILQTNFESVNSIPFAGKTVTMSFYARVGANYSGTTFTAFLISGTGTDQSLISSGFTGQATVANATITPTTSWVRYVITGTVPTNSTQLCIDFAWIPSGTAGANDWIELTGVQIDVGTYTASSAPTFRRSGGTLAGELAACQRYYWRQTVGSDNYQPFSDYGLANATTAIPLQVRNPVPMRTNASSLDLGNMSVYGGGGGGVGFLAVSSASLTRGNPLYNEIACTVSGATIAYAYRLQSNNNANAFIGFSAEL